MHMLEANHLGALATLVTDRVGAAFGELSPSACAVLLTTRHWQPVTVSELAEINAISQPTATRVVDGLIRAGLLSRAPKRGRRVDLSLTGAGAERAGELEQERDRRLGDLLALLGDRDREAFSRLVARLLGAATQSRAQARTTCRYCDHETCSGPACPVGTRARAIEAGEGGQP